MDNSPFWLTLVATVWTVCAGIWTWKLEGIVPRSSVFNYSIFMLISSVCIYGLASFATELAQHSMISYATSMFKIALGSQDIREATALQIQSAAQHVAARADNMYMIRMILSQTIGNVLKYFVPAIMAALGVWSLEKCMEKRITVS